MLYVSPSQRFISGNLTKYLDFARNGEGISAWPTQRRLPTTSMTHPNMFDVFLRQTQFQGMNAADPAKEAGSPVDIADYQVWPLKNCWFLFYQPYSIFFLSEQQSEGLQYHGIKIQCRQRPEQNPDSFSTKTVVACILYKSSLHCGYSWPITSSNT